MCCLEQEPAQHGYPKCLVHKRVLSLCVRPRAATPLSLSLMEHPGALCAPFMHLLPWDTPGYKSTSGGRATIKTGDRLGHMSMACWRAHGHVLWGPRNH